MREMNREIVDLRQNLHLTTKALNSEVYRKPGGESDGVDLAVSQGSGSPQGYRSGPLPSRPGELPGDRTPKKLLRFEPDNMRDVCMTPDLDFGMGGLTDLPMTSDLPTDLSSADSADIIAEAKYRMKNLDQERASLEKAMHDFHCRMTNVESLQPAVHTPKHAPVTAAVASPHHSPLPGFQAPLSSTPYNKRDR